MTPQEDACVLLALVDRHLRALRLNLDPAYPDNDGAFLNAPMEQWCEKHQPPIVLTRSRVYQSNDQASVEQKNGMLIRRVVGY